MPKVRVVPVLAVVAALLLGAACGSDGDQANAERSDAGVEPSTSSGGDQFPVTIEHKFGETVIPAEPKRIVTIGWNDQEYVLALGVVPLAAREWFDGYTKFPWVAGRMQGKKLPTIGSDVNTEKVASYKPDLIIAIYDTVNKKTYNTYSKIAPTIIQSDEYKDEETPWNEQTLLTGRALGKTADAEALVAGVDADFAAARAANPEFANLTLVANFYPDLGTGEHWLLGAGDPRRQLFDSLGFMAQDERDGVSEERSEVLDRDVLVVNGATKEQMTKLEVFSGLDVVTEDRTVFIPDDTDLSAALAYGSVISLPYALEQLQPLLAAAADGNPATKVG